MLELIRLEGQCFGQEHGFMSRDIHLLQMCSGIDEAAVGACSELVFAPIDAVGACSELVFAPIDEMFPDDTPLLPSGFHIIPLDVKSVELDILFTWIFIHFLLQIQDWI